VIRPVIVPTTSLVSQHALTTTYTAMPTIQNLPYELWIHVLKCFVVRCASDVLDVPNPLRGADRWTSLRVMKMRVGADFGAFVKPLVDAVPKARLCWDRWHPVIVSKAIAVHAPIVEAHVTAAGLLYNEAKGTILKLEGEGVDQAEIISQRDQLAPLPRVFQHEQRRRESVQGLLKLGAEVGPRRRSAGASGDRRRYTVAWNFGYPTHSKTTV
jgi:hypothetical protein